MKKPQAPSCPSSSLLTPLDYAYRLLARRAYSEEALAEKMLDKGFSASVVARTITRLKEQGYVNDLSLAADQVERLRTRGFGQEAIKARLVQKGLSTDDIERALVEAKGAEQEAARQFLASRFSADALKDRQTYGRAYRLLIRRGYAQAIVETLLGHPPDAEM